jgi:hypothetical protein
LYPELFLCNRRLEVEVELRMGAEIESGEDQEGITGKVGDQYEQAVLAQCIALEVSEDQAFDEEGDDKRDGQPNQWVALKEDEQDAVDDAGNDIHQKRNLDTGAGRIPVEKGKGDPFDETEEEVNDEQGEKTEDDQYDGGGRSGDGGEEGGWHGW